MDAALLFCSADPALKNSFASLSAQTMEKLPTSDELGKILPDILLLDMDLISDVATDYLAEIADRYPSIQLLILADSKYPEDILFAALRFGCQGWIFKDNPDAMKEALIDLIERRIFLKPYVSQLLLEEFKKFGKGESLLAMEEEILRQNARGVSISEIEKNLNLNPKSLRNHWESIRQKAIINTRAASISAPEPAIEEKPILPKRERVPNEQGLQVITFSLGNEEFAIGLTDLQEIERVMTITPLPNVPPSILGVMNLRGKIVPVVDLRVKLGIPASASTKESRVMIVNDNGALSGLFVDSVKEVLKVPLNCVSDPPPLNVNDDLISGIMNLESRLILLLDLKKTMAGA